MTEEKKPVVITGTLVARVICGIVCVMIPIFLIILIVKGVPLAEAVGDNIVLWIAWFLCIGSAIALTSKKKSK